MIVDGVDLTVLEELADEEELFLVWHRDLEVEITDAGRIALAQEGPPSCV